MKRLRADLAWLYREVCARGLAVGSSGNVSGRTKTGMLITPTGASGESLAPADLVAMDLDGKAHGKHAPSSEWRMHAGIYCAHPAAMVIVHTHSDAATALGVLGTGLPAFHYDIALFGGDDVRLAPYALFGSAELAAHAVAALEGRSACLLAHHGMVAFAADARAALLAALRLEAMARQYLMALAAGQPRLLDPAAMEQVRARYATYGKPGQKV
jgi:L-fuculose-phosphate aldolase